MDTDASGKSIAKNKSKIYFIIAAVFLILMALMWAVDLSLIYIFLGLACSFFFLGFFNRPRSAGNDKNEYSFRRERQTFETRSSVEDSLKNIFQRRPAVPGNARKFMTIITVSIFLIIVIPIIISLFSADDGSYNAYNYLNTADQQYQAQEYDSAYVNYKRAMQLDPELEEAMLGYGKVLIARNERDSAILIFNRLLETNPEYRDAVYNKALVLYDQKKYSDGINLLTPFIEANPDYYDAMLLLGDCYYIQKNYDDAIVWYENAYQNGGLRSRMLCHIMAYIYDTKGEYEKAISLYKEALGYDSSVVDIYQRLGELIPGDEGNFFRTKAVQLKP